MGTWRARNQQGLILKARVPENAEPLSVTAGEELVVSDRAEAWQDNPEWMWVWCTDPRGKSAWAPGDLLEPMASQGQARARYDYDAVELSVAAGDHVRVDGEKNGWYWCTNSQAEHGWVPIDHVTLLR